MDVVLGGLFLFDASLVASLGVDGMDRCSSGLTMKGPPAYSGIVVDWLGMWPYYCSNNALLSPGPFA